MNIQTLLSLLAACVVFACAPGAHAGEGPAETRAAIVGSSLEPLHVLLKSPDRSVKLAAIRALGRIEAAKAGERLARLLVEDPGQLGREAGRSLAAIGKPAWPRIMALAVHKEPRVRSAAMALVVDAGLPGAVDLLVKSAASGDRTVRLAALDALSTNSVPAAVKPVMELAGDPDPWVRHAAVCALGRMGDPAAEPVLRKALKDEKTFVAKAAAKAMEAAKPGDPEPEDAAKEESVGVPTKQAVAAAIEDLKHEDDRRKIEGADRIRRWLSSMDRE